jgi:hypothetical protein
VEDGEKKIRLKQKKSLPLLCQGKGLWGGDLLWVKPCLELILFQPSLPLDLFKEGFVGEGCNRQGKQGCFVLLEWE